MTRLLDLERTVSAEDLILDGEHLDVRLAGAVLSIEVERTMEGASTITLDVHDPDYWLIRQSGIVRDERLATGVYLEVDGLPFVLAEIQKKERGVELVFYDQAVASLQRRTGAKKATRGKVTRAEFVGSLAREAGVQFISPDRHKPQQIADSQEDPGAPDDDAGPATEVDRTYVAKYQFRRGANESSWDAMTRLAEEVGWRCFAVGQRVWFASDLTLARARPSLVLREGEAGVDRLLWLWTTGRQIDEVEATVRSIDWPALPGSVVIVEGEGTGDRALANGKWLVRSIRRNLLDPTASAQVTLGRPQAPKLEPASRVITHDRTGPSNGAASAEQMVSWAKSTLGTTEGSALHRQWAADIGNPITDPWCSIWLGYGLKHTAGLSIPAGAAYSGIWLNWRGGTKVSLGRIEPGDLVIFDWGDGGITDHVALYIGGDNVIGGNQGDKVSQVPLSRAAVVGVVRPKYRAR